MMQFTESATNSIIATLRDKPADEVLRHIEEAELAVCANREAKRDDHHVTAIVKGLPQGQALEALRRARQHLVPSTSRLFATFIRKGLRQ